MAAGLVTTPRPPPRALPVSMALASVVAASCSCCIRRSGRLCSCLRGHGHRVRLGTEVGTASEPEPFPETTPGAFPEAPGAHTPEVPPREYSPPTARTSSSDKNDKNPQLASCPLRHDTKRMHFCCVYEHHPGCWPGGSSKGLVVEPGSNLQPGTATGDTTGGASGGTTGDIPLVPSSDLDVPPDNSIIEQFLKINPPPGHKSPPQVPHRAYITCCFPSLVRDIRTVVQSYKSERNARKAKEGVHDERNPDPTTTTTTTTPTSSDSSLNAETVDNARTAQPLGTSESVESEMASSESTASASSESAASSGNTSIESGLNDEGRRSASESSSNAHGVATDELSSWILRSAAYHLSWWRDFYTNRGGFSAVDSAVGDSGSGFASNFAASSGRASAPDSSASGTPSHSLKSAEHTPKHTAGELLTEPLRTVTPDELLQNAPATNHSLWPGEWAKAPQNPYGCELEIDLNAGEFTKTCDWKMKQADFLWETLRQLRAIVIVLEAVKMGKAAAQAEEKVRKMWARAVEETLRARDVHQDGSNANPDGRNTKKRSTINQDGSNQGGINNDGSVLTPPPHVPHVPLPVRFVLYLHNEVLNFSSKLPTLYGTRLATSRSPLQGQGETTTLEDYGLKTVQTLTSETPTQGSEAGSDERFSSRGKLKQWENFPGPGGFPGMADNVILFPAGYLLLDFPWVFRYRGTVSHKETQMRPPEDLNFQSPFQSRPWMSQDLLVSRLPGTDGADAIESVTVSTAVGSGHHAGVGAAAGSDRISSSYRQKEAFSEADLHRLQRTHLTSGKRPKIFWRGTPTQRWNPDVHGGKRIAFDKYVSHLKKGDRDSADSVLDEWWDEMERENPSWPLAYARWQRCPVDGSKDDESSDQAGSSKGWSPGLHSSEDHVHSQEEIEESGKDDSYHDVGSEFRSKRHHDSNFKHDADVSANPPHPELDAAASSLPWRPGFVDSLSPEDASHPGHRKSSHELWMKLQSLERGAIQKERKFSAEDREPANISTADSMPDTGINRINTEDSSSEIINPPRVSLALIRFSETLSASEAESSTAQVNTNESNASTPYRQDCDNAKRVLLGGSTGGSTSEKCVLPSGDDFVAVKTDVEVDVEVSANSLPEQFSRPKEPEAHQGSESSATAQQTPLATTPLTTLPTKPLAHLATSDADVVNKLYSDFGLVGPKGCDRSGRRGKHMKSLRTSTGSVRSNQDRLDETTSGTPRSINSSNVTRTSDTALSPGTRANGTSADLSADLSKHSNGRSQGYMEHETSSEAVHRNGRVQLVHLSNKYPHLINARFITNVTGVVDAQGEVTEEGRGYARKNPKPVGLEDQIRYKFWISFDGSGGPSTMLVYSMWASVLVFRVDCCYETNFSHLMIPFRHYIPVRTDLADLVEKIEFCKRNPEWVDWIIAEKKKFFWNVFDPGSQLTYVFAVMRGLGEMQNVRS